MSQTVLQVFVFADGIFLGDEIICGDRIVAGSGPDCDLVLDDDLVSQNHVAISVAGQRLIAEDLETTNGTSVSGRAISGPTPVGLRDDLLLGRHRLKLKLLTEQRALDATRPAIVALDPIGIDDEDRDPDDEPAPFSLLDNLLGAPSSPAGQRPTRPVAEVIRYRDHTVRELAVLGRGRSYSVAVGRSARPVKQKLVRQRRDGSVEVFLRDGLSGWATQNGTTHSMNEIHGRSFILQDGDFANLDIGYCSYFVRFAHQPALRRAITGRGKPTRQHLEERSWTTRSLVASLGSHFIILLTLFISGAITPTPVASTLDDFPRVDPGQLPPATLAPTPAPETGVPETEAPAAPARKTRTGRSKRLVGQGQDGLVQQLRRLPRKAPGERLVAVTSNLDAAHSPSGNPGYKVSEFQSRGPTNRVSIGGRGGAVATTTNLDAVLRNGGQPGALSGRIGGGVRGKVKVVSRSARPRGEGHLSRAEIQKVVNRGLGAIQHCYEKALLSNSSLSGKVEFEWTIDVNGRVHLVRTIRQTLPDTGAVTCMAGEIRGWRFPQPKGNGTVIVTFPFVFNAIGF